MSGNAVILNKVLRVNLESEGVAKAVYMAYSVAYRVPAQPWSDLPIGLRCSLIELAGRILLSLEPSRPLPTTHDLREAVNRFATDLGRALAPVQASVIGRIGPTVNPHEL
jgi:hypothetical protein